MRSTGKLVYLEMTPSEYESLIADEIPEGFYKGCPIHIRNDVENNLVILTQSVVG